MGGGDDGVSAWQSQYVVLGWYCCWVLPAAEYHGDAACHFGGWLVVACSVMMHSWLMCARTTFHVLESMKGSWFGVCTFSARTGGSCCDGKLGELQ